MPKPFSREIRAPPSPLPVASLASWKESRYDDKDKETAVDTDNDFRLINHANSLQLDVNAGSTIQTAERKNR